MNQKECNEPISNDHLSSLAELEKKEFAYWKPKKVGDIVFNYWD